MRSVHRWWVAGILAALVPLVVPPSSSADLVDFAALGTKVLGGRFDEVYAGTFTQAGPLQLVLSRVLLIGGADGVPHPLVMVVIDVALMLGAMAACRGRAVREVVVAVLALLWLIGPMPWTGHPVESIVGVLWAYAIVVDRKGRWPAAALMLGVSVWIAPVAVLGFPCMLAVSGGSSAAPTGNAVGGGAAARTGDAVGGIVRAVRTWVVAGLIAVVGYVPFVVSGRFEMFGHVWPVDPGTLPYLLGLREVTWATRLGQAVIVAGGCAAVAWLLRGRLVAVAAAPAAAGLLRVVTDPLAFGYYWLPVAVGSVLLVALLPDDLAIWRKSLVAAAGYVTVMGVAIGHATAGALLAMAGCLVAAISNA
ncbi:hypothetical protein [Actinoplanes sp. NPDC026670]|uniref:hypothetical protein n=1 Tax=Actinoplanes sp. NPDC026670 TaxID=3154700 RepID=UPI0033FD8C9E